MAASQDPYQVLGVARDASADDIRRAYRRLARENHPDLKPGDRAAEERFKAVSAANDVLGDAKRRKLFDEFGEAGLREGFDAAQARAYGAGRQARGGAGAGGPGAGFGFDVGEMFGDFFGRGGGRGRRAAAPGADLQATVQLDLREALAGKEVVLDLPVGQSCAPCQGSGRRAGASPRRCGTCRGSGHTEAGLGGMGRARCGACGGSGQVSEPCPACAGQGQVSRNVPSTVRIPAGAEDGAKLRVSGRGAPGQGGPGDLILKVEVRAHPWFRRDGLDLIVRLPVTVHEAMAGTQVPVPTLGGEVRVRVPAGTQSGTRLRLRGKGVSRSGRTGDMLVEIGIRVPTEASEAALEAARALEAAYSTPVRQGVQL